MPVLLQTGNKSGRVKVRERPPGSGKWWVFINHHGRRKSRCVGSLKAAKMAAEKIQAKLVLGDLNLEHERKTMMFKAYREYWPRTYAAVHCKVSTLEGYESVFENHLTVFDQKALDEVTRQDVREMISKKLIDETKSRGTVRNIIAPLREMFNHAIDEGILTLNPANRIGQFIKQTSSKASRMKIDPLTRGEVEKLLSTAKDQYPFDVYALLMCAVRTGMRMGELFGLEWGDLDFNSHFVQVQRSWVRGQIETPKSGQLRRIDMSRQLADVLQELRRRREVLFFQVRAEAGQLQSRGEPETDIPKVLGIKYGRSPDGIRNILKGGDNPTLVFVNEEGGHLDHSAIRSRVFEKLLVKAELRKIRFHDLRHTFASLLLQQKESPQYVKEQMGHHSGHRGYTMVT